MGIVVCRFLPDGIRRIADYHTHRRFLLGDEALGVLLELERKQHIRVFRFAQLECVRKADAGKWGVCYVWRVFLGGFREIVDMGAQASRLRIIY